MNAVDDCVAYESESASKKGRGAAPPAGVTVRPIERQRRSLEARLLAGLLDYLGNPPLEFALWTGECVRPAIAADPIASVCIGDRAALIGLLADPQVRFGESYSDGRITVEGDLVQVLENLE